MNIKQLKSPIYFLKNFSLAILYSIRADQEFFNPNETFGHYNKLADKYWKEAEKNLDESWELVGV